MNVHEPATLLTDLLLGGIAGILAFRLHRSGAPAGSPARWWSGGLGLTAVSAVTGGSYHGFAPNFPASVAAAWWLATLLVICLLSAALAMALLHELVPPERRRPWRLVVAGQLAVFAAGSVARPVFLVAVVGYGLVLLAWAMAALWLDRPWCRAMLTGIGLSAAAVIVQQKQWDVSGHFNHNDLYHLIQAVALFAFYRAAKRMGVSPKLVVAAPAR